MRILRKQGDLTAYNYLLTLLKKDLSIDANYQAVAELVDIENFTDYLITELGSGNKSINHNVMAWKPKEYGKWRWIVMDLDRGFFSPGDRLIDFYQKQSPLLLGELIQNQSYKEYFARRLSAQIFTSYNPVRMKKLIDEHAADIEAEIPRHIARWLGRTSDYGDAMPSIEYWEQEVENLKTFVEARPAALINDLQRYGFSAPANLSINVYPEGAGEILIDGLKAPGPVCSGPLPMDIPFHLVAESRPGYDFTGWSWSESGNLTIFPRGTSWKYLDTGVFPGTNWIDSSFNDGNWPSGNAQLGYDEGDENTLLSYGGDKDNKYTTYYFRKSFILTEAQAKAGEFEVKLLKDDGALVYLNGTEIIRTNMPSGTVDMNTFASSTIGGGDEDLFVSYPVDGSLFITGENLIAVEIHQVNLTSSDVSFDLELSAFISDSSSNFSSDRELTLTLDGSRSVTANFTQVSSCLIPSVISEDITLGIDCSPYMAGEDILVTENATLTIDPGVEIWMSGYVNIIVEGEMTANGSSGEEILFRLNPGDHSESWGGLIFHNTNRVSKLNHLVLEDASKGPDPVTQNAAISAFNADLVIDHLIIENTHSNPIIARYSDITLTNSQLHSRVTGDLINVKYGKATIENCVFRGNDQPDTDAIDYDEIENGIIRNCRISDFTGINSDAIDIGENASNILIDSIIVYRITDKGVSLGQRSTAKIQNSVFIRCNMGIALKDSCNATINHVLFYGNDNAVAGYEKNPGHAGGNGKLLNSILSNSGSSPVYLDSESTLEVSYCLSDNDPLQDQNHNILGNPLFTSPTNFDFAYPSGSPVQNAGIENGTPVDLGVKIPFSGFEPPVVISEFFINAGNLDQPEYIRLYNPGDEKVDLSGFTFTRGITATLPEGTWIESNADLFITSDITNGWSRHLPEVIQWEEGRLANQGEAIKLTESNGITVDYLAYKDDGLWPGLGFTAGGTFKLKDPGLDNHLPENWTTSTFALTLGSSQVRSSNEPMVFPNPTRGMITIQAPGYESRYALIYNLMGQELGQVKLDEAGSASYDLSPFESGVFIIRIGKDIRKVLLNK